MFTLKKQNSLQPVTSKAHAAGDVFFCQNAQEPEGHGVRDKNELGQGREVNGAEHGGRAVRGLSRLSTYSISHSFDCQGDIMRTDAVRVVVRDWEGTCGMHESTKILWEQTGPF